MKDEQLRSELEQLLSAHFGTARRVVELEQRPNPYRSSFVIHEIDVTLDDGSPLELILKDLSWHSLEENVRAAKPSFVHDPLREIEVYRGILGRNGIGTATCYGAIARPDRDMFWLLLERVRAQRLSFVGEFSTWEAVAHWLARTHEELARAMPELPPKSLERLLRYDGDFYRRWPEQALMSAERNAIEPSLVRRLRALAAGYDQVVERLVELPSTIIHGEFYADNVLVHAHDYGLRVCPVDWEMAALGPGLIDVAGLAAGTWSADERRALALAYHGALTGERPSAEDFLSALPCCQVHLALQWAGLATQGAGPGSVEAWLSAAFDAAAALEL